MRIAQVTPLFESVLPKYYGGAERVISYLTEESDQQGHDITLFTRVCFESSPSMPRSRY